MEGQPCCKAAAERDVRRVRDQRIHSRTSKRSSARSTRPSCGDSGPVSSTCPNGPWPVTSEPLRSRSITGPTQLMASEPPTGLGLRSQTHASARRMFRARHCEHGTSFEATTLAKYTLLPEGKRLDRIGRKRRMMFRGEALGARYIIRSGTLRVRLQSVRLGSALARSLAKRVRIVARSARECRKRWSLVNSIEAKRARTIRRRSLLARRLKEHGLKHRKE